MYTNPFAFKKCDPKSFQSADSNISDEPGASYSRPLKLYVRSCLYDRYKNDNVIVSSLQITYATQDGEEAVCI